MQNQNSKNKPCLGLALGAGGARGWAHLGVLKRLTEIGVPIDCVAGTSAGAIVGAFYLTSQLDLLELLADQLDWRQATRLFFEINFPRSGLLTGNNITSFLHEFLGIDDFQKLERPFAAVATDLDSNREVIFKDGSLMTALRASISIPGIFTPVRHESRNLVDGALVNPLPVSVLKTMGATKTIAVDVNLRSGVGETVSKPQSASKPAVNPPKILTDWAEHVRERIADLTQGNDHLNTLLQKWKHRADEPTIFEVLAQTTRILENQVTRNRLMKDAPDILIQPAVGDIATLDATKAPQAIAAGVCAVDEKLSEIKDLMSEITTSPT